MKFDDPKKEGIRVGNSVYTLKRQPQGLPLQYEHGFSSRDREEVRFKLTTIISSLHSSGFDLVIERLFGASRRLTF